MGKGGETSGGRPRRHTDAERLAIVREAFGGGSSVSEVADRHGVSCASIYLWRRQAREGAVVGRRKARDQSHPPSPVTLVPVQIAPAAEALRPHPGRIEIALANGRIVRVCESIDPMRLARLVAALESPAPIEGGP